MMGGVFPATGRVLVVDDAESNRYVLATWLRRAGHDVVEAGTGAEGLAIAAAQPIDLVVLDINLPDMSGYAVCERLKNDERMATVPVLHVSATAVQPSDRSEGLRRGADGYLVEPVEREELVATVEALLRGAAAHRTALRLAERLRRLNDATLAVNEPLNLEQLIATIAREASVLFEAEAVALVVVNDAGLRAVSTVQGEARVEHCAAGAVDAVRKAVGEATFLPALSLREHVRASAPAAYVAAPLHDAGGHRGVLLVAQEHATADETELVLQQYARAASTAIRNVRTYDIERRIALTLQQNLLPDAVAAMPGLDVAVRYEASAQHAEVGGDFYEIFSLAQDRVAFAIGDVVGHSLQAAMVMAQLRTGIRSYLLEGHGPAASLERLNHLLCRFHPGVTATVCCGVYDSRSGVCEVANAGHVPPLVANEDGVRFLPIGGTLLGVDAPAPRAHSFSLAPGDLLLLFTDGLVERRGESIDAGLDRLAAAARGNRSDVNELCDRVLREVGPENVVDDIALVALRAHARAGAGD
ncbi:MAG: response regulator receiver protein [Candidatus Eremiobacteraeota bacterium]|nr:response regulator receiver protein [Candidatus Eremiobacteraeota bacterium]